MPIRNETETGSDLVVEFRDPADAITGISRFLDHGEALRIQPLKARTTRSRRRALTS